eukprot:1133733-Pelagomonas_calceolata.AAC.1
MSTIPMPPPIQHTPSSGASQPQHDMFDFSKHVPVILGTGQAPDSSCCCPLHRHGVSRCMHGGWLPHPSNWT